MLTSWRRRQCSSSSSRCGSYGVLIHFTAAATARLWKSKVYTQYPKKVKYFFEISYHPLKNQSKGWIFTWCRSCRSSCCRRRGCRCGILLAATTSTSASTVLLDWIREHKSSEDANQKAPGMNTFKDPTFGDINKQKAIKAHLQSMARQLMEVQPIVRLL